jgi:hypothetical protein
VTGRATGIGGIFLRSRDPEALGRARAAMVQALNDA